MPRAALNEEEMGKIALAYVRMKVRRGSTSLDPNTLRREIGNTAKDVGIDPRTALQFTCQILDEAFKDVLVGLQQ